jgi:hypothetical protein
MLPLSVQCMLRPGLAAQEVCQFFWRQCALPPLWPSTDSRLDRRPGCPLLRVFFGHFGALVRLLGGDVSVGYSGCFRGLS